MWGDLEGKRFSYLLVVWVFSMGGFSYVCSFLYLKKVCYNLSVPHKSILENSHFLMFLSWSIPPSIKLAVCFPLLLLLSLRIVLEVLMKTQISQEFTEFSDLQKLRLKLPFTCILEQVEAYTG